MMEGWSEAVVEQALWTAQAVSSYREAEEALWRLARLAVSKTTLHRMVAKYGEALVQGWEAKAEALWKSGVEGKEIPPPREGQKAEIGISLDGVMVWVDDGWHEVKVGCCFEFGPGDPGEVEARRIGYRATYGEVEAFRRMMWGYAYHRGLGLDGKGVVVGDGAAWIDGFAEMYCPKRVRIVDWYHAVEHLWALGREAYGEGAEGWVEGMKAAWWSGQVAKVVEGWEAVLGTRAEWRGLAGQRITFGSERSR